MPGALAAAPFRAPASNEFGAALMLAGTPSISGLTATFEATKPGNMWAAVVSQANAASVTVATAKSAQMWAYGALSCRKIQEAVADGTLTTLSLTGCSLSATQLCGASRELWIGRSLFFLGSSDFLFFTRGVGWAGRDGGVAIVVADVLLMCQP
ncbi:ptprf [Symbiodinium pilosum]|uniref:Ptprf protein n=1 Tax=Symbiodinium pilosum TaxID=2952 RepID=A0A812JKV7_SYMPI|nr:ptprf [Symbiodinium pilosum]